MNIYSIKEIVKATNNFLKPEAKIFIINNIKNKKIKKEVETVFIQKKNNKTKIQIPLLLDKKIETNNKIKLFNYKINIKPEIKNHMVNEIYLYLKKKIKKNTLKLIIEEQIEIKNLKNKINQLKQNENHLKIDYEILQNNYETTLKNNEILNIKNDSLENNLNQLNINQAKLNNNNYDLKINLKEIQLSLDDSLLKNRSFEINNSEIKNTISRYIINNKKLQVKINLLENAKNLESENEIKKVKFYQDENVRLSSELLLAQKNNEYIKENLNNIQIEKEKISNKIKELNKSIEGKSNIISSSFNNKLADESKKDINKLNDTEQKTLDEVINRIFSKI